MFAGKAMLHGSCFYPLQNTEFGGYTMERAISVTDRVRARYYPSLRYHFIGANIDQLLGLAASTVYFNVTFLHFSSSRKDLMTILTEVNKEVGGRVLKGWKQMPEITSTLRKHLIFEIPQSHSIGK